MKSETNNLKKKKGKNAKPKMSNNSDWPNLLYSFISENKKNNNKKKKLLNNLLPLLKCIVVKTKPTYMDQTAVMYTDDGQTFVKLGGKKRLI